METIFNKNAPTPTEIQKKLANFFNVSIDFLCGSEVVKPDEEAIKIALFGEDFVVTDSIWKEVKNYISFIKEQFQIFKKI